MAERNKHIPYSSTEILVPGNQLEQMIFGMAEGKLPSYEKLPSTFRSTKTEAYANWLHNLTRTDPHHRERGAVPHVRRATQEIIYPSNPDVGKEDGVGWVISKNVISIPQLLTYMPITSLLLSQELKEILGHL